MIARLRTWLAIRRLERHIRYLRAMRATFVPSDYSVARKSALTRLGDRWLLAHPINRRRSLKC